MKRIIQYVLLILCFVIELNMITVMADSAYDSEDTLELYGESALLLDAKSGNILYEKKGNEVKAIASTTKVLTCLIALENGNLDDIVTVSENAASQPDVQMHIVSGEQYRLGDLLVGMMLESYNDVSVAVAEHISGSTEAFAQRMNERAKSIGCKNSCFITPNGLDAEINGQENGSTAYDIALIMAEAINNPEFLEITQTRQYTIHELENKRTVNVYNRNAFLDSYEGVISGKTGFTGKAGYCYVCAVKRDDRTFIAVTLGSGWPPHKTYKWTDMRTLFDYGFANYKYRTLDFNPEENKKLIPINNAKGNNYKETVYAQYKVSLDQTKRLLNKNDSYYAKLVLPKNLQAPLEKGEIIGTLEIYVNNTVVEKREIRMAHDVVEMDFFTKIYQILRYFFAKICRKPIEIT